MRKTKINSAICRQGSHPGEHDAPDPVDTDLPTEPQVRNNLSVGDRRPDAAASSCPRAGGETLHPEHSDLPHEDDDAEAGVPRPGTRSALDPATVAARFMVREVLRDVGVAPLASAAGTLLTVRVPDEGWLGIVADQWRMLARAGEDPRHGDVEKRHGFPSWVQFERGESRPAARGKGEDVVQDAAWKGFAVVGFSTAPERLLPPALVKSADLRLTIPPPSAVILRKVARAMTGSYPARSLAADVARCATPSMLRLARRPGQSADEWMDRVANIVEATRTPPRPGPRLLPGTDALAGMFRHHLRGELLGDDLEEVCRRAEGCTGADVARIVRSARQAARHAGRATCLADLERELPERPARDPSAERRVAIHEAGHAVATAVARPGALLRVQVGGNGPAAESVTTVAADLAASEDALAREMVELLGGRAAEEAILGSPGNGSGGPADSDLARATACAFAEETAYGLGGSGLPNQETIVQLVIGRPDLAHRVALRLTQLFGTALDLVRDHRAAVVAVSERLLADRSLTGAEVEAIVRKFSS